MQRKHILLFAIIFLSFSSFAQYSVGIKSGYVRAWEEYGDVDLPDDAEIDVGGLNISLLAYRNIGKFLSVGVEPGYVERGAACIPGGLLPFDGDTKYFLKYMEVPIAVRFEVPVFNSGFKIGAKTGYSAAFLTEAHEEITNFLDNSKTTEKLKLKDSEILNRWDHGVKSGVQISRAFGRSQLFVGTDYFFGLRDAEKRNVSKNRSLEFNLGYTFQLNSGSI